MTRLDRRAQIIAVALALLAGFVDGIGFVSLGGFFVSFMSGNSTRLGVGLTHDLTYALTALGLIAAFVVGAAAGSLVGHAAAHHRRSAVLLTVAGVLALAAALDALSVPVAAAGLMAFAMGAENATFEEGGETRVAVTYMTGALVKMGQRLASVLRGGSGEGFFAYALLWLGLVTGAVAGATAYSQIGVAALWVASGFAALVGLLARTDPPSKAA
jgi:uncharacterized membrane protein YoaK (UPF0700 family)